MKYLQFDASTDGFYGAYWESPNQTDSAVIAMIGDDALDHMAKCCVKWLIEKCNVNVLTMSPGKKDYSHHNYPLERIKRAIEFLKTKNNERIGIIGASTTGTLALVAASYFHDITLTIALTPSDFIWQGFAQGSKDGCSEWPIEGESLFSYEGKPLPYMPFCYKHPDYYQMMKKEAKETKNMIASRKIFDDSEALHPITEEEFIKVENIKGYLLMIGAADDSLWDTVKYINRAKKRLDEKPNELNYEVLLYDYGTHFVFPDSLLKKVFPICSSLILKLVFRSAKEHSKECKNARLDIERQVLKTIRKWQEE